MHTHQRVISGPEGAHSPGLSAWIPVGTENMANNQFEGKLENNKASYGEAK